MNTSPQPWRIVLIPRPLSLAAAFVYFLLSRAQIGGKPFLGKHYLRWVFYPTTQAVDISRIFDGSNVFINLDCDSIHLERIIVRLLVNPEFFPGYVLQDLTKLKNFFLFYGRQRKHAWAKWLEFTGKLSFNPDPHVALSAFCGAIDQFLYERRLPEAIGESLDNLRTSPYRLPAIPDMHPVPMPVSKHVDVSEGLSQREVYGYASVPVEERNIFELMDEATTLIIGGPPGVGKSTLAAGLFTGVKENLAMVTSRGGEWRNFSLSASLLSLDGGTEVASQILANKAQNREQMQARKRPWDREVAREVAEKVHADRSNLIIADLPGLVTDLTRLVAVRGTYGILLASHGKWAAEKAEWKAFFDEMRIPVIVQVKSTDHPSMMTTFRPRDRFYGRIHRPARMIIGGDPFVRSMTEFLLFDTIPGRLARMHDRIERQVAGEEFGYRHSFAALSSAA